MDVERWKFELRQAMLDYGSAVKRGDQAAITETSERGVRLVDELAASAQPEPVREPDGWKCSECHNVNNAQGVVPGKGWCSLCGAVDSMQPLYCAAPPAPQPDALFETTNYAHTLACGLHVKHYSEVTQWRPLPDLLGLLTQIDNMATGLVRAPQPRVPLTSLEIYKLRDELNAKYAEFQVGRGPAWWNWDEQWARAIEAKLGIKSEGE